MIAYTLAAGMDRDRLASRCGESSGPPDSCKDTLTAATLYVIFFTTLILVRLFNDFYHLLILFYDIYLVFVQLSTGDR